MDRAHGTRGAQACVNPGCGFKRDFFKLNTVPEMRDINKEGWLSPIIRGGAFSGMDFEFLRLPCFALVILFSFHGVIGAQQLPPAEPPESLPGAHSNAPTIRVTTNEVLVPTLVEKRDGTILYGLKPSDFVLEDDGVPRKSGCRRRWIRHPFRWWWPLRRAERACWSSANWPNSALCSIYFLQIREVRRHWLASTRSRISSATTRISRRVDDALRHLEPGDGGAAILDTVNYAVDLLESQPKDYRRVLLLISEERDHGSKHTKPEQLIRKIGHSDVLVLSVSFSPSRAELLHDLKDSGDDRTMNMVSALVMAVKAFKKNVAKEVAADERRRVHHLYR